MHILRCQEQLTWPQCDTAFPPDVTLLLMEEKTRHRSRCPLINEESKNPHCLTSRSQYKSCVLNRIDLRGHMISIRSQSNPRAEVKLEFHFWISETFLKIYLILEAGILFLFWGWRNGIVLFYFCLELFFPWKPPLCHSPIFWRGAISKVFTTFHAHPTLNNCLYVPFIVTSETRWRNQGFALERINFFITLILTHILFPTCSKKTIQIFPSQDNIFNSFCVFPIFGCFCINRLI